MIVASEELNAVANEIYQSKKSLEESFLRQLKKDNKAVKEAATLIFLYVYVTIPWLNVSCFFERKRLEKFLKRGISEKNFRRLKGCITHEPGPVAPLDQEFLGELKKNCSLWDQEISSRGEGAKIQNNKKKKGKAVKPLKKEKLKLNPNAFPQQTVFSADKDSLIVEQEDAATSYGRSVLVASNPGSGKSKTLVERAMWLCKTEPQDNRILVLTFTLKAAGEIKDRILTRLTKVSLENSSRLDCRTFHSWAYRILMENHKQFGFEKEKPTVINDTASINLIQKILETKGLLQSTKTKEIKAECREVFKSLSFIRNREKNVEEFLKSSDLLSNTLSSVYVAYTKEKRKKNLVDFDDLVCLLDLKLRSDRAFRKKLAGRYQHILVDEVQDCNNNQFRILKQLSKENEDVRLFVCGDEKQSIYGFRSTNPENVARFVSKFKATVYYLDTNFRSYQEILNLANITAKHMRSKEEERQLETISPDYKIKDSVGTRNGIVLETKKGITVAKKDAKCLPIVKTVRNKPEQNAFIGQVIKQLFELNYKADDIAILYRTNAEAKDVSGYLNSIGLPFKVKGSDKKYKKEPPYIKIFLDMIKMADSFEEHKELWKQLFYEFLISNEDACEAIYKKLVSLQDKLEAAKYPYQVLTVASKPIEKIVCQYNGRDIYHKNRKIFVSCCAKAFKQLTSNQKKLNDCAVLLQEASRHMYDLFSFKFPTKNRKTISDALLEVISVLTRTGNNNLITIKEMMLLEPQSITNALHDEGYQSPNEKKHGGSITLSTIHGYKGLEAKNVILINCVEGSLPHFTATTGVKSKHKFDLRSKKERLKEERRLFYVACTRARDNLVLVVPSNGKKGQESRFIREIRRYVENHGGKPVFQSY